MSPWALGLTVMTQNGHSAWSEMSIHGRYMSNVEMQNNAY